MVPGHLARAGVERHHVGVRRVDVDLVAVDRDRAGPHAGPNGLERLGGLEVAAVLPDAVPGDGIDGLHDVPRARDVHHAVVDQRSRLAEAAADRPPPDELQLVDVGAVDLVQRAVAPTVERSPPVQPVGGIRFLQHRVGDRLEVALLRLGRRRPEAEADAEEERQAGAQPRHEPPRRARTRDRQHGHGYLVQSAPPTIARTRPACPRGAGLRRRRRRSEAEQAVDLHDERAVAERERAARA